MKVLIDIGHPAHVHFFRNLVFNLQRDGHQVKITARDKEVSLALLKAYGLDFELRGEMHTGMLKKAFGLLSIDFRLLGIARKFRPDILMGIHNPYVAHVGAVIRKTVIIFTDTENVKIASMLTYPFAQVIITPVYFKETINPNKHVTIKGLKEIAYLHPKYFTPQHDILDSAGIDEKDRLIILRFISWGASHDVDLQGIRKDREKVFIDTLSGYGKVLITSERPLDSWLEKYRIRVPPEKMHSLLSYASLYIGEGGTMAAEAAVLGTPSIHIESTGDGRASGELSGNFNELRDRYGLMYFYGSQDEALKKAVEILENPDSKEEWQEKKQRLLADVIDVTSWMTEFVEDYPRSFEKYRISQSGKS